jgi:hypothetical protein
LVLTEITTRKEQSTIICEFYEDAGVKLQIRDLCKPIALTWLMSLLRKGTKESDYENKNLSH